MNEPVPLCVPKLDGNELKYLTQCIETGWVSSAGTFINEFENALANYVGVPDAVATCSGTAALHMALRVLDIGPGDEVIVPTITFIATANAVRYVGAEPVFVGCDRYLNIDAQGVQDFCEQECTVEDGQLVNRSTGRVVKAVMPVHVFGHPADMESLLSVAKRYRLFVVEDATEALGSRYVEGGLSGKMPGVVGHIGCYSFNGNKIITSGGGGMLVTPNKDWAERARYLTTQAKDDVLYSVHGDIGYNYRMTNIEAAVGLAQLERLDEFVGLKREHFGRYHELLEGVPGVSLLEEPPYARSNYWFYTVVFEEDCRTNRDRLLEALCAEQIESRPLWRPLHLQPPYEASRSYGIESAVGWYERTLNLPCSVGLTDNEIERVCSVVKREASGEARG